MGVQLSVQVSRRLIHVELDGLLHMVFKYTQFTQAPKKLQVSSPSPICKSKRHLMDKQAHYIKIVMASGGQKDFLHVIQ